MNLKTILGTVTVAYALTISVHAAEDTAPASIAWKELQKAAVAPSPPRDWFFNKPSDDAINAFNKERAAKALAAADLAKKFQTDFAKDEHVAEARALEFNLLTAVVQLGDASVSDRMLALQETLVNDTSIDAEERLGMLVSAARSGLQGANNNPVPAITKAMKSFQKAHALFPDRVEPAAYILELARMLVIYDEVEVAREALKQLEGEGAEEGLRQAARAQLKKFDRIGKPVPIAFTAIDGRKVDTSSLKGKVVLIDFWATWCGPCVASLPELLETYKNYHEKGFEVIGISGDENEEALKKMVKDREIPWPQFFEENNHFLQEFEIEGFPTVWLIDKKGNLRYLNARLDLEGKLKKLLAEE